MSVCKNSSRTGHKYALFIALALSPWSPAFADSVAISLSGSNKVIQGEHFGLNIVTDTALPILHLLVLCSAGHVTEVSVNGNTHTYDVQVGQGTPLGNWGCSATAVLTNGSRVHAESVEVNVEPATQFESISIPSSPIILDYIGDMHSVSVEGNVAGSEAVNLVSSTRVTYEIDNQSVATFDSNAFEVVAMGVGTAVLTATYIDEGTGLTRSATAQIVLNETIPGDLDRDHSVDIGDFNEILQEIEDHNGDPSAVSVPHDGRDINHDGRISEADLYALLPLCEYPNCNFRPLSPGEPTPTPILPLNTPTATPTAAPTPTPHPHITRHHHKKPGLSTADTATAPE